MKQSSHRFKLCLLVLCTASITMLPLSHASTSGSGVKQSASGSSFLSGVSETDGFVYHESNGEITCRMANPEEAQVMRQYDPNLSLHVISPIRPQAEQEGGLKIIMRATQQLEGFPAAKATFLRAAAFWEALIQNPITIVIDVDFGPTFFGQPFGGSTVGRASRQTVTDRAYTDILARLITDAGSEQEASLYKSLPTATIPTDLGTTNNVVGSSALFRVLGFINPVADPDAEQSTLGTPPRIGFKSTLNPARFDSVALHEIGHVLGFTSNNGRPPDPSPSLTIWDLFRFRPGTMLNNFATAPRIASVGGQQVFFAGGSELPVSTGGPDGDGGDGSQSSHWKARAFTGGRSIGIMVPSVATLDTVTVNDLAALDVMGYTLKRGMPIIEQIGGSLQGDVLTLSGMATDPENDMTEARVMLTDSQSNIVNQPSLHPITLTTPGSFTIAIKGMNQFPSALQAQAILVDGTGKQSLPVIVDFSQPDSGGPFISKASFGETSLTIKGSGLADVFQVEINGVIIAPPIRVKIKGSGKKLKVSGSVNELNLRTGPNRVRVLNNGSFSKIVILTL